MNKETLVVNVTVLKITLISKVGNWRMQISSFFGYKVWLVNLTPRGSRNNGSLDIYLSYSIFVISVLWSWATLRSTSVKGGRDLWSK